MTGNSYTIDGATIAFRDELDPNGQPSPEPPAGSWRITRTRIVITPSLAAVNIWYETDAAP